MATAKRRIMRYSSNFPITIGGSSTRQQQIEQARSRKRSSAGTFGGERSSLSQVSPRLSNGSGSCSIESHQGGNVDGTAIDVAPLALDWKELYKTRRELDKRWVNGEPRMMRIAGHEDRYVDDLLYNLSYSHGHGD